MQNHLEISSRTLFWTRNVPNWTKSRELDMSGPAKTSPGGQVLVAKPCLYFFLLDFMPFIFLLTVILFFIKTNDFSMQNHLEVSSKTNF